LFVVLGLAALVIDLGFARLAQRQMQTAVDTAALEGLRNRDRQDWPDGQRESLRRQEAGQLAANVFDDDLNPANGDRLQMGAGRWIDFSGGMKLADTEFYASQTMSAPDSPVYDPLLQINASNLQHGDMVAGSYGYNAAFDTALLSDENNAYARRDFVPSDSDTAPEANAFLVRMRRTNNADGLDELAGVSSRGPALPYLFGRGTALDRNLAAAGVTVRATAIAAVGAVDGTSHEVGRAKTAGPPYDNPDPLGRDLPGVTPFAMAAEFWDKGVNEAAPLTLTVDGSGALLAGATEAGQVIAVALLAIGHEVQPSGDTTPLDGATSNRELFRYVPIYESIGSQPRTVIGFGHVEWTLASNSLTLTINENRIGCGNLSGVPVMDLPSTLTEADIGPLFQEHAALARPVYSPVLVNRHLGPNS
jgi:hypothetical protein